MCAQTGPAVPESRAGAAFDAAKRAGPLALRAFLEKMPKGADLHLHFSGAVYAETFIDEAAADHLCFVTATLTLAAPKVPGAHCEAGQLESALALTDPSLYNTMVDALSLRDFVPSSGFSGHDQFFSTFLRFDAIPATHRGEWLDEIVTRAARQNEQYLEIMDGPNIAPSFALAAAMHADVSDPANFEAARKGLPPAAMESAMASAETYIDGVEAQRKAIEHCGTAQAAPGCTVQIRWIASVLRDFPPEQLYAMTLLGFELAARDPRVVGINFMRAEDWHGSIAEYHLGMQMVDYMHRLYPKVHIALHAGELAPGSVPPVDLTFHIREAVELGHAERIGHGVDVMDETDPKGLLKELADKHIMVEINLTSNDVILRVKAPNHPLPLYRAAHVPVALSTDDEGVSRIDLTHEYTRAALEFGLNYKDLKQMARTGMEHTFLPGKSLWTRPDDFTNLVAPCAAERFGADPVPACGKFLAGNPHAWEQWELERRFRAFENTLP